MSLFQKIITAMLTICVLFIGYYFIYALPAFNQAKLDIQQREVELKKEKQELDSEKDRKELELKTQEQELKRVNVLKDECTNKGNQIKKEYNNIASVNFDNNTEECMVTSYDDNGISSTYNINVATKVFKKPKPIPYYGFQTIIKGVNLREYPPNGGIIQVIDPSNKVYINESKFIGDELWYNITFNSDKEGWISSIAFGQ